MHEAGRRAHVFGQIGQKGYDVMVGFALNLINAGNFEGALIPDFSSGFFRDHAQFGLGIAGMRLDLEPNLKLTLGRPDGRHFGARIARDHGLDPCCWPELRFTGFIH